ncbi:MAG: hypothetical protein OXR84_11165 [Magnetovibrio sp.]|nr:hypothetical protein [Magnetovibrio sp.]
MSTYADLDKPPFFTAVYLDAAEGSDAGMHSEATSMLLSLAMTLTGFVGFRDDMAAGGRAVKIVYWRTYAAMQAWEKTARDLLPHKVGLEDCVASAGCLWRWLDDPAAESATDTSRAA